MSRLKVLSAKKDYLTQLNPFIENKEGKYTDIGLSSLFFSMIGGMNGPIFLDQEDEIEIKENRFFPKARKEDGKSFVKISDILQTLDKIDDKDFEEFKKNNLDPLNLKIKDTVEKNGTINKGTTVVSLGLGVGSAAVIAGGFAAALPVIIFAGVGISILNLGKLGYGLYKNKEKLENSSNIASSLNNLTEKIEKENNLIKNEEDKESKELDFFRKNYSNVENKNKKLEDLIQKNNQIFEDEYKKLQLENNQMKNKLNEKNEENKNRNNTNQNQNTSQEGRYFSNQSQNLGFVNSQQNMNYQNQPYQNQPYQNQPYQNQPYQNQFGYIPNNNINQPQNLNYQQQMQTMQNQTIYPMQQQNYGIPNNQFSDQVNFQNSNYQQQQGYNPNINQQNYQSYQKFNPQDNFIENENNDLYLNNNLGNRNISQKDSALLNNVSRQEFENNQAEYEENNNNRRSTSANYKKGLSLTSVNKT